jgi:hypothetical protein
MPSRTESPIDPSLEQNTEVDALLAADPIGEMIGATALPLSQNVYMVADAAAAILAGTAELPGRIDESAIRTCVSIARQLLAEVERTQENAVSAAAGVSDAD